MNSTASSADGRTPAPPSLAAKVQWRLGLPAILFMLLSSLDRAAVSFAAHEMNADLGFTPTQYGLGAGILFVGFLAGQYPSVLLYQRVGMRRWIATCAAVWGLAAAAMAFMQTTTQFYALRIVLGVAEGGLAPGIVLYLSQFASARQRASTFALPMLAIPASIVVGGPLAGLLMEAGNPLELPGWRWMLLAVSLPTVALAALALAYFPDRPAEARWLAPDERAWLAANAVVRQRETNDWSALRRPVVWLASLLWFLLLSGSYGLIFWLPQVVRSLTDVGPVALGMIGALPWVGVGIGMYWNSRHSDRTDERYWHTALPALLAAAALLAAWSAGPGPTAAVALFAMGLGLGGAQGTFWALPTRLLGPQAMAVGVVAINIAGSAGGLVMPHAMGVMREASGGFAGPTMLVVAVLACAATLVAVLRSLGTAVR